MNKGLALSELGRSEDALQPLDSVVGRFGGEQQLTVRELVARGLLERGIALERLGRAGEAAAAYGDVVHRYGEASEPELTAQVARARDRLGGLPVGTV